MTLENNKQLPSVEVFELDMQTIIDNALREDQWGKSYPLFNFEGVSANIHLTSIRTYSRELVFEVEVKLANITTTHVKEAFGTDRNSFFISLDNYTLNVISRKIRREVERGMYYAMINAVTSSSPTYDMLREEYICHRNMLRQTIVSELVDSISEDIDNSTFNVMVESVYNDRLRDIPTPHIDYEDEVATNFSKKYIELFDESFSMMGVEENSNV